MAMPFSVDTQIIAGQRMPTNTMCFASIHRSTTISTEDIFPNCHGFQMAGVHTLSIPAQVVDGHAVRNRADEMLVRYSMTFL